MYTYIFPFVSEVKNNNQQQQPMASFGGSRNNGNLDYEEDLSLNDESGEANEETTAKPSVMLKRRRTKSIMPPSKFKAVQ